MLIHDIDCVQSCDLALKTCFLAADLDKDKAAACDKDNFACTASTCGCDSELSDIYGSPNYSDAAISYHIKLAAYYDCFGIEGACRQQYKDDLEWCYAQSLGPSIAKRQEYPDCDITTTCLLACDYVLKQCYVDHGLDQPALTQCLYDYYACAKDNCQCTVFNEHTEVENCFGWAWLAYQDCANVNGDTESCQNTFHEALDKCLPWNQGDQRSPALTKRQSDSDLPDCAPESLCVTGCDYYLKFCLVEASRSIANAQKCFEQHHTCAVEGCVCDTKDGFDGFPIMSDYERCFNACRVELFACKGDGCDDTFKYCMDVCYPTEESKTQAGITAHKSPTGPSKRQDGPSLIFHTGPNAQGNEWWLSGPAYNQCVDISFVDVNLLSVTKELEEPCTIWTGNDCTGVFVLCDKEVCNLPLPSKVNSFRCDLSLETQPDFTASRLDKGSLTASLEGREDTIAIVFYSDANGQGDRFSLTGVHVDECTNISSFEPGKSFVSVEKHRTRACTFSTSKDCSALDSNVDCEAGKAVCNLPARVNSLVCASADPMIPPKGDKESLHALSSNGKDAAKRQEREVADIFVYPLKDCKGSPTIQKTFNGVCHSPITSSFDLAWAFSVEIGIADECFFWNDIDCRGRGMRCNKGVCNLGPGVQANVRSFICNWTHVKRQAIDSNGLVKRQFGALTVYPEVNGQGTPDYFPVAPNSCSGTILGWNPLVSVDIGPADACFFFSVDDCEGVGSYCLKGLCNLRPQEAGKVRSVICRFKEYPPQKQGIESDIEIAKRQVSSDLWDDVQGTLITYQQLNAEGEGKKFGVYPDQCHLIPGGFNPILSVDIEGLDECFLWDGYECKGPASHCSDGSCNIGPKESGKVHAVKCRWRRAAHRGIGETGEVEHEHTTTKRQATSKQIYFHDQLGLGGPTLGVLAWNGECVNIMNMRPERFVSVDTNGADECIMTTLPDCSGLTNTCQGPCNLSAELQHQVKGLKCKWKVAGIANSEVNSAKISRRQTTNHRVGFFETMDRSSSPIAIDVIDDKCISLADAMPERFVFLDPNWNPATQAFGKCYVSKREDCRGEVDIVIGPAVLSENMRHNVRSIWCWWSDPADLAAQVTPPLREVLPTETPSRRAIRDRKTVRRDQSSKIQRQVETSTGRDVEPLPLAQEESGSDSGLIVVPVGTQPPTVHSTDLASDANKLQTGQQYRSFWFNNEEDLQGPGLQIFLNKDECHDLRLMGSFNFKSANIDQGVWCNFWTKPGCVAYKPDVYWHCEGSCNLGGAAGKMMTAKCSWR